MRHRVLYIALTALFTLPLVFSVRAESIYSEVPVSEAGTINGKVIFSGEIPAPKVFKLKNYPHAQFCRTILPLSGRSALKTFFFRFPQTSWPSGLCGMPGAVSQLPGSESSFKNLNSVFLTTIPVRDEVFPCTINSQYLKFTCVPLDLKGFPL